MCTLHLRTILLLFCQNTVVGEGAEEEVLDSGALAKPNFVARGKFVSPVIVIIFSK